MTELEQVRSQMTAPQADEELLKQYPVKRQENIRIQWIKLGIRESLPMTLS